LRRLDVTRILICHVSCDECKQAQPDDEENEERPLRLLAGDTLADLLEMGWFAVGERCKQVGGEAGEKGGMRSEEINEREVSEASQARECGRRSDVRAGQTTYGCLEAIGREEVGM
jgi:hypothetical protein